MFQYKTFNTFGNGLRDALCNAISFQKGTVEEYRERVRVLSLYSQLFKDLIGTLIGWCCRSTSARQKEKNAAASKTCFSTEFSATSYLQHLPFANSRLLRYITSIHNNDHK